MGNKEKLLQIHERAISYDRIKSLHIIKALYKDIVPWYVLPGFSDKIKAPSGQKIHLQDDPTLFAAVATFIDSRASEKKVAVIAQQTPAHYSERREYNYGLTRADGYGLAYNMMRYAENRVIPLHIFIDTVGADPFEYSAAKLQSWLIAACIEKMLSLTTRSVSTIIGCGGSGGAIALQLAHRRFMLSSAEYGVISPEGCSAILFRSPDRVGDALEVLGPNANRMRAFGIIDKVIKEPDHAKDKNYFPKTVKRIRSALHAATHELERYDIAFLQKELREKVNSCATISDDPHFSRRLFERTKEWIRKKRASARVPPSSEVSLMRRAVFGKDDYAPYACNDDKDADGQRVLRKGCHEICTEEEYKAHWFSCPHCGKPVSLYPEEYIDLLFETNSFREFERDLSFEDMNVRYRVYDYSEARKKAALASGSKDAINIGEARLYDMPVAVAISDFRFMGGSMGAVVGEKIKIITEHAIAKRIPFISVSVTGGARMQEGTIALYQMAKTAEAVSRVKREGLPYISLLGHPTTGGTLASYAALGDFIIAEKKATVAFAGERVVALASGGRKPSPEIMTAEFFEKHGGIHIVAERRQLKSIIAGILRLTSWYQTYKVTHNK